MKNCPTWSSDSLQNNFPKIHWPFPSNHVCWFEAYVNGTSIQFWFRFVWVGIPHLCRISDMNKFWRLQSKRGSMIFIRTMDSPTHLVASKPPSPFIRWSIILFFFQGFGSNSLIDKRKPAIRQFNPKRYLHWHFFWNFGPRPLWIWDCMDIVVQPSDRGSRSGQNPIVPGWVGRTGKQTTYKLRRNMYLFYGGLSLRWSGTVCAKRKYVFKYIYIYTFIVHKFICLFIFLFIYLFNYLFIYLSYLLCQFKALAHKSPWKLMKNMCFTSSQSGEGRPCSA
jgi:hypothetical protein